MAARHTEHESDEMAREATRKVADQAARSARVMSATAESTARAGVETAQRNSERMLTSWRSGTDAANRIAERSLDQFYRMFGFTGDTARQTLQQSSGNMHAMLETTTILADGLQDVSGEWGQFVQGRTEQILEHFDRMLECRSLQEWMALQTQMARDQFEAFLETAKRTAERSTRVAEEAARKINETTLAPQ
jgi:phasin family protein